MSETVEFICVDCGVQVYHFGPIEQCERCGMCQFIFGLPEDEREQARKELVEAGIAEPKRKNDA